MAIGGRLTPTGEIRNRLAGDLAAAREAGRSGNMARCWALLEDTHVLSQPWAWSHVCVHAAMLATALRTRDAREFRGQVLRLAVGGPASLFGRYPIGHTGRSDVPATRPMPIREELATLLARAGQPTG